MENTKPFFTTDPSEQYLHFRAPGLNLTVTHHEASWLNDVDTTTFADAETGETIVTVPSNIKEISTWDDWKKTLKKISKHSPVYRVIKAIFDGKLFAAKDPEDEYDEDYIDYLSGYEI